MKSLVLILSALLTIPLLHSPTNGDEGEAKPAPDSQTRRFDAIDLQPLGNQVLSNDFHGYEGNNFKPLPRGRQTFNEVAFAIGDKMIQLASKRAPDFPEKVTGIQVNQTANRLHFLHGTGWGSPGLSDGTLLGGYVVHYEDGSAAEIPLEYGRDVRDWWMLGESLPASRAQVAWTGVNDASKDFRGCEVKIRLFQRAWENPHPEKKIESVDFHSRNETISAPFLVALTAESIVDEAATIKKLKEAGVFLELGDDQRVKQVSLSGPGLKSGEVRGSDANLDIACDLPSIEIVYANYSDLTDEGLQSLQKLPRLKWLSLNLTDIGDAGLAHLTKLEGLERLRLHKTRITNVGLAHLAGLEKLEVLDLSETAISDDGLDFVALLPALKKLDLHGTKVTDAGVAKLKDALPGDVEISR